MVTENEIREWFLAESKAGNSEKLVELSLYLDNIIEKNGLYKRSTLSLSQTM